MQQGDTIGAIATPPGMGGVGIVRLSGEEAIAVAEAMFSAKNGKKLGEAPQSSFLYGHLLGETGEILDEAIVLVMRSPRSYTREDVVEFQCHGGPVVLRAVLERAFSLGVRPAERGEFTKRAFLNGRLDLSEAQAVMEVVGARTEASLRMASGRLAGRFSGQVKEMRQELLEMIAHLEATIDFPEEDIDDVVIGDVRLRIAALREKIGKMLETAHAGAILRDGLKTAIIGKPNVGKSSLMNAMLFEERVIVTDTPGTTRDSIEVCADVGGIPLSLIDTAGIRETEDRAEKIGVERARACAEQASLVLAVFDASSPAAEEDEEILSLMRGKKSIVLFNKSDCPPCREAVGEAAVREIAPDAPLLRVSAKTGEGMETLAREIEKIAYGGEWKGGEASFVADAREADLLRRAASFLSNAAETVETGMGADFIVIDLRSAWESLGEITGETVGEDIIDEIFRRFCIGK